MGAGWEHVQSQVFPSEIPKVQTDAQAKGSALHRFYPFNSMPGSVRDQLSGKTAHQRPVELGITLGVSDLANRRTWERPKGTLKYPKEFMH